MLDTHGKVWLFECNFSPGLCQHGFARAHDEQMLRSALAIVEPPGGAESDADNLWELTFND